MERKNRNLLVVLIAAVIGVAVLTSFGINLFTMDLDIIPLPSAPVTDGTGEWVEENQDGTGLVQVTVTPETVQNVIATIVRPESYYRVVTLEDFWGGDGYAVSTAQVWVDYGWTRTRVAWSNGVERTSIVGEDTLWWWYSGDRTAATAPADDQSADLEGQRIPTYETILELEQSEIVNAGYEEKGGLSCIYVETKVDAIGYHVHYWVSVEDGLLVAMETWEGEQLVATMSSYEVERPAPAGTVFALPSGEILHTVGTTN